MANRDDKRRRGQDRLNKFLGSEEPKGLNPLDLITSMPDEQRKVINWLARRRRATAAEVAEGVGRSLEETNGVLRELQKKGDLRQTRSKGELYYRVVFGGRTGQISGDLPADIWTRIETSPYRFLRKLPIFAEMDKEPLTEIAEMMTLERYERGDVIVWQGEAVKKVFFVKSGIAGVSVLHSEQKAGTQFLNYLQQGTIFGEYSLLAGRDVPASATVSAMTTVQLLSLPHEQFLSLLETHSQLGIGLSRLLTERLIQAIPKQETGESNLVLVFGMGAAQIGMGASLAAVLGRDQTAVYTEYPAPHNLISQFSLDYNSEQNFYTHPLGFDLAISNVMPSLPQSVRITMLLKELVGSYHNVVIGLPWRIDDAIAYLLERADQIVLVSPTNEEMWPTIKSVAFHIHTYAHPEKSAIFTVETTLDDQESVNPPPFPGDFRIDEAALGLITTLEVIDTLPNDLHNAVHALADRLGRTNQISVFIPTTVDVNKAIDTRAYVDETLALLGRFFGGATSSQAEGVWNSEEVGLVGETVYIVRSYATKLALNNHLSEVLLFVEHLKEELSQEAMAVEVNQKLMLI